MEHCRSVRLAPGRQLCLLSQRSPVSNGKRLVAWDREPEKLPQGRPDLQNGGQAAKKLAVLRESLELMLWRELGIPLLRAPRIERSAPQGDFDTSLFLSRFRGRSECAWSEGRTRGVICSKSRSE